MPALSAFLANPPPPASSPALKPKLSPPIPRSPAPSPPKLIRRTSFNSSPALSALPNGRLGDSSRPASTPPTALMPHSRPPTASQNPGTKRHISQSQSSSIDDARPSWEQSTASAGSREKRRRVIVQDEYDEDDEDDGLGQRDEVDQLAGASQAGE